MKQPNSIDKHIGTRIRMRRMQLGLTQEKLADALGVSFQQVQKYEKGTNRVGGSRMAEIARLLDVDVGFFYQGAPGADTSKLAGAEFSLMDEFMASREGLMIARAFVRIPNAKVRATIAASIAALSEAMEPAPLTIMAAE
ncbi:helix-turn-helix domain-containing protein [Bradyrhizobium sp. PMVTL-01]|uniref:helix-turn-helix domain-containing protein n=1 Tax=Bradyrhizobium sp. PMVTL-01 TaxID=3434999 RepID=UPI003F6F5725